MTTAYDNWLFSNQGNEPKFCPHCNAHLDDCICDEDDSLQRQLTELDSQQDASIEYMRGINQKKQES